MERRNLSGGEVMLDSINVNQLYPRWLVARENSRPFVLIDVRSPDEFRAVHVPGAKLIALNTLMARANEIPKEGDVYLICHSGARSAQAAMYLGQQLGYNNLINVDGGTMAWTNAGYPVEKGA
ncbi:Rhodanese-related sulfurtransferase [Mariprofundus aestuarium]|uniref:Rhodanese-related sulfurtransferase n=1 Tax=Mariprofundus aestuarium TaxID=1921086 RepID=A0A2K8KX22_MARES|nr:rhodanese-like domain-containing protein [Mariprofundus aestuarium]ATX79470.1 Rhodanese-related sulfurtransferase [Mariprofundus aestuarium]